MEQSLVIHRPAAELRISETDVYPFASIRHQARHGAGRADELSGGLFPIPRIEAEYQVGRRKAAMTSFPVSSNRRGMKKSSVGIGRV